MKIYLTILFFIFSTHVKAQSNDQIGTTMADCAGWLLASSFVFRDVGDREYALDATNSGQIALDVANKLLGQKRTDPLVSVGMKFYNQNKNGGDVANMRSVILAKGKECNQYMKLNQPQIRRAVTGK